jgi:hypothetical protein
MKKATTTAHLLDFRRTGDAKDDDVALRSQRTRRLRLQRALAHLRFDRRASATRDRRQRPAFSDEVGRHSRAHQAQSDESDSFFHCSASCMFTFNAGDVGGDNLPSNHRLATIVG